MYCSKQIGTFWTFHDIIMSNKQPWRFLLYSWGILREPPHFCVDESVYNHPNNWPHFVPQKVTLTRSELSFFYSGKNKKRRWLWVSNGKKNSISNSKYFFIQRYFICFQWISFEPFWSFKISSDTAQRCDLPVPFPVDLLLP